MLADVFKYFRKMYLEIFEKGIRDGICDAIHRFAKSNSKHMNDYDHNKESLYLKYWDANNLYG